MDTKLDEEVELEGPFLTLADFIRAQEIRERLKRRNRQHSKPSEKFAKCPSTFALTATGHEEVYNDDEERQSSHGSDGRPATSLSMATTAHQLQRKKAMNKAVQTVTLEGPLDPGSNHRFFRVDFMKLILYRIFQTSF